VLAVTFPDRPLPRRRALLGALVAVTLIHVGLDVYLYDRHPHAWMRFFEASTVYLALAALASCVLMRSWYRRAPSDDRARLQVVALGAAIGFGVPSVIHLATMLEGVTLPVNVLPIATTVFPIAVTYAILKHDVLALDPVLVRSTFYALLTTAVTVGYVTLVVVASTLRPDLRPYASTWGPFVFTLAVVGVITPLRRAAQNIVDRLFFRSQYDPEAALEAVSRILTVSLDRSEIAAGIARTLADTMAPAPFFLLLPDVDGHLSAFGGARLASDDPLLAGADDPGARVVSLATAQGRGAGRLRALGVTLVVPLRADGRAEGILALGPKQSGALYGSRDLALLRTLANQAAIALRNAASYAAVRELTTTLEQRVDDRTRELVRTQAELARADKLASLGRLVAGVAHEINNPVAFVNASVDLIHDAAVRLREGLDGQADDVVRATLAQLLENASICRDGASRAARIVRDLTAFSRAARSKPEPVDVPAAIERTLQLLRGEYKDRITIVREYGTMPHPYCNASEIDQLLMNLVANAVQAIDGPGQIEIRTRTANGSIFVEVRDSGRGIPPELHERIFEPFFTTRSGDGTGLGLAIVHSVVARHGGDLTLRSTVGEGTSFTVRLPLGPPSTETP
jgi:signal transduction histidine kinase